MATMEPEWEDRVRHWIRTLKADFYEPIGKINWEAFITKEHLPLEDVLKADFVAVEPGFTWGKEWEYCWFKGRAQLPESAEGKRIVMDLQPDGESTLFVNNKAFGTYRAAWVDQSHQFIEDNVLSENGKEGEIYDILMETYAGGSYYEVSSQGWCATGPVLPGEFMSPLKEGERRILGESTFGIWNEDAYQLYMDVDTLEKLLQVLDDDSLRAAKIIKALEQFTLIVDFEQCKEKRIASYIKARKALQPVLEKKNGPTTPVFYAMGNAHLDLAWLWPMAETYRKTERTFAAQLRLIEEYPNYRYIQSQPAAYEMCRQHYPELFERIKNAIRKGQWIADGAMWVEPDTNLAGGEALIRQLIHGKRYYKDVLGVDSEILWLPDTFGYTAALPQILQGCGVKYLVTQKIFWNYNGGDRFPYHYFKWKGMDGSTVVSFLPTSYTYRTDPAEANKIWKNRVQKQDLEAFLMPFGYGDGGGGPARDFIEYAQRQEDLEGGVKIKMASPLEFFKDMDAKGGPTNTYVGELYFSAHRGTYTSQAMIKKNNRKSEIALREMEFWSVLARERGCSYDYEKADALWKELLLHQFHDILPGSSIARVYQEAEQCHIALQEEADNMKKVALNALVDSTDGKNVSFFNSLSFTRTALVQLPKIFSEGAITTEGEEISTSVEEGKVKAILRIPSGGGISILPAKVAPKHPKAIVSFSNGCFVMENEKIRATIDKNGEITSYILKQSGREFAAQPMNRFRLFKDVPRLFDAWDIDSNYQEQEIEAITGVHVQIVSQGLEAVLKVTGTISNSTIVQYIRLTAQSFRIEFDTTIDWRELHRLLKVSFPVTVFNQNGINEIQFGYVERPTHRSRQYDKERYEVCNHRYSALADGSHGAAILNDCKYGISMNENAMELTLLRASACPEMRADNRIHQFTYAFTAWEGNFAESDVTRQAYELNVKPQLVLGKTRMFESVTIDCNNVFLESMKPAEDGSTDVILRLYEAQKAPGKVTICTHISATKAYLCDMLENIREEIPFSEGKFTLIFGAFQIYTIRLVK